MDTDFVERDDREIFGTLWDVIVFGAGYAGYAAADAAARAGKSVLMVDARCDLLAGHVGQVGGVLCRFLQLLQVLEGTAAAEDRQPDPAFVVFKPNDFDQSNFTGQHHMRRTAGTKIIIPYFHDPYPAGQFFLASIVHPGQFLG